MAINHDDKGNVIRQLDVLGGESLFDDRVYSATLALLNAEVFFDCAGTNSVIVDIRGTFTATLNMEATVDGTNYFSIPVIIPTSEAFLVNMTAAGVYMGHLPAGCKRVRVRCSAFTSGSAVVALRGSTGDNIVYAKPIPSVLTATTLGAANTAATLTIPAAGAGLFHYITYLRVDRINNSATGITGTALLAYTTTNIPGSLAFSAGNAIAAGGQITDFELPMAGNPLKTTAANTATTIVAPAAGAGVQVRITAIYYTGA